MDNKMLPDFHTLVRMKEQGLTDAQVGELYGVTAQAVNKALNLGGFYKLGSSRVIITEIIPWAVKRVRHPGSHHSTYLGKAVMAYLKVAVGDSNATDAHRVAALRLHTRLVSGNKVIDYSPVDGFFLTDRTPQDGDLIFRWPKGKPLPDGVLRRAVTLAGLEL